MSSISSAGAHQAPPVSHSPPPSRSSAPPKSSPDSDDSKPAPVSTGGSSGKKLDIKA